MASDQKGRALMEIFSMEGWYFLLRWFHFLAGITWIGILYYFNLVQTPFLATELGGQARGQVTRGLLPTAMWWFRWGAMFTFLTGWLIVLTKIGHDKMPLSGGYLTMILTGGLLGTFMWYNVWFMIWPIQRRVIASADAVAAGGQADPEAAKLAPNAGLASRTNTMISLPMLFFMGAASHFPALQPIGTGSVVPYWIVVLAIVIALEVHVLIGNRGLATQKYLTAPAPGGVIHAGLGLALLLYLVASALL
jgi:uncharacterized membrane protein